MNRREAIKTASAALLGAVVPICAGSIEPSSSVWIITRKIIPDGFTTDERGQRWAKWKLGPFKVRRSKR